MSSIISDIKKGNISGIYLFYGEEAFKKRLYKEALKEAVVKGNMMNYAVYEGRSIDWQSVFDTVQTMPFFADRKLVIIENSGKFKAGKDGAAADEKTSSLMERVINEKPDSTCLAFFEDAAAKNRKLYKTVASKGVVCECTADTEEDLINWLARGFASRGKKVRKSTLSLLVSRTGLNYDMLRMEFEKIVSYAGEREVIEDSDILEISTENTESRIFELLNAMSGKNVAKVLERYHELLLNREHPLYIMAMLRSQLRTMLQVTEMYEKGMNPYEIAKAAGKPSFAVNKALGYRRSFSKEQIIHMLDEINDVDRKSKRGLIIDQLGAELLLIKFSS